MINIETLVTAAIILAAGIWLMRWLRSSAGGDGGCGCGKCAKSCAKPSDLCLKGREH